MNLDKVLKAAHEYARWAETLWEDADTLSGSQQWKVSLSQRDIAVKYATMAQMKYAQYMALTLPSGEA